MKEENRMMQDEMINEEEIIGKEIEKELENTPEKNTEKNAQKGPLLFDMSEKFRSLIR